LIIKELDLDETGHNFDLSGEENEEAMEQDKIDPVLEEETEKQKKTEPEQKSETCALEPPDLGTRKRTPQRNRTAGRNAEVCRYCGLLISAKNMERHIMHMHKTNIMQGGSTRTCTITSDEMPPSHKKQCPHCEKTFSASNFSKHMKKCSPEKHSTRGGRRKKCIQPQ
jgi:hypothetical protein